ncbi:hypothetical protein BDV11DRAFT_191275 [Aspergillus similis]
MAVVCAINAVSVTSSLTIITGSPVCWIQLLISSLNSENRARVVPKVMLTSLAGSVGDLLTKASSRPNGLGRR